MPIECIPYSDTNYFSNLICDYVEGKPQLKQFYNRFPNLNNFKDQIAEKKASFPIENRQILAAVLTTQYANFNPSEATSQHINLLKSENTFTVTTGHQLNLFTGPLYFLYKIISTINLTEELKKSHPENNFVPIYWMATEDHDFEEINYFNFKGKKIRWPKKTSGAVGALSTEGLEAVLKVFASDLPVGTNADKLKTLFKEAYLNYDNLSDATRYLANALFADYGLVIIDAQDKALKKLMIPYVEKELTQQLAFQHITKTNIEIEALDYGTQVNPRDINFFYLKDGFRERITMLNDKFQVVDTTISFSKEEILKELFDHPERFSPNVVLRPLYQEVILPNLCYIGGGGELAYWLQLKSNFEAQKVIFPILLLRNSALIKTTSIAEKLRKLNISNKDLFLGKDSLINKKIRQISNIDIDFSPQKEHLKKQFEDLHALAKQTDASFKGAVKAQEVKQIKGLENLEKRLLKAQKRKLKDQVERLADHHNQLFPNQSLQERQLNFSEIYLEYGESLIPELIAHLQPLKVEFSIVKL
ncbi:bacillithiol biosynthesis cysteine-adding enzyme BshC [Paucihalobacter sp.]|uniref:bacillithiol biosynthesis cysteine-adding enzyme BshC n=1 Tax=Paucihalobacter sp. TaxID=2850405 RepID=UPI002FE02862